MTQGKRKRPLIEPEPDPSITLDPSYADTGASEVSVSDKHGFVPWQPGQSGNPNGRPKYRTLTEYLRDFVDPKEQAQALIAYSKSGGRLGLEATIYIYNRLDGAPKQSVDVSRSEDDPAVQAAKAMAEAWDRIASGYSPTLIEAPVSQPDPESK